MIYKVKYSVSGDILFTEIVEGEYNPDTRFLKATVIEVLSSKNDCPRERLVDSYNISLPSHSFIEEVSQQDYPEYFLWKKHKILN